MSLHTPESPGLSFLSSYCGDGVKVHPIRLPHIVKRSISSRSLFVVLCLSSVDCGVSLLLSSGLGGESGGGSLVTSVTGGGAGGKGFALGGGCLVMEVVGRWTSGSAKNRGKETKQKSNMILWKLSQHKTSCVQNRTSEKITWIIQTGVTWGWGRFGGVGFLGSLLWGLSSRSFKQLTLHVSFFHISTGRSQNNYTIQHFQCYQSAESDQTIKKIKAKTYNYKLVSGRLLTKYSQNVTNYSTEQLAKVAGQTTLQLTSLH